MKPSLDDKNLVSVSHSLGIPVKWLWNLINFESRWNPQARAGYPYNKAKSDLGIETPKYARGLIQFIDPTAQELGYLSADDLVAKNPDTASQLLFPVLQYLSQYKPFKTESSFYLSVFHPTARNWPLSKEFPAGVQDANPGIRTPGDYVRKVQGIRTPGGYVRKVQGNDGKIAGTVMVVLGVAVYIFMKKERII